MAVSLLKTLHRACLTANISYGPHLKENEPTFHTARVVWSLTQKLMFYCFRKIDGAIEAL